MKNYIQHWSTSTPQSAPIPEAVGMVRNRAGGFVFEADDWTRLQRFLILGTDQGSYYATARELTREAATCIDRLLESGQGLKVVDEIVAVSDAGRAPKNDPAILALALCLKTASDAAVRRAAANAVPKVCRTGSHLASLVTAVESLGVVNGKEPRHGTGGGWGPLVRKAIGDWLNRNPADLAFQAVKYGQRQDWRWSDLLRLSHARPASDEHALVFDWILERQYKNNEKSPRHGKHTDTGIPIIEGYEAIQAEENPVTAATLVRLNRLPWEAVPSQWARNLDVQAALFERMPLTATIRQLGRLTGLGLLTPGGEHTRLACERITSATALQRARVHPMAVYLALRTYQSGQGKDGKGRWTPVAEIVAALESAFFAAFRVRPKSRKRLVVGVDCSGSMWGQAVSGTPGLTAAEAASVMAFLQVRENPNAQVVAFSTYPKLVEFRQVETLGQIQAASQSWGVNGGTDCAQPMLWALQNRIHAEGFCIYTDDETWAGTVHPVEAVSQCRQASGLRSKLVVASMVAHGYRTAGGYDDAGMLQVVGLDEAAPGIIDDFLEAPIPN